MFFHWSYACLNSESDGTDALVEVLFSVEVQLSFTGNFLEF